MKFITKLGMFLSLLVSFQLFAATPDYNGFQNNKPAIKQWIQSKQCYKGKSDIDQLLNLVISHAKENKLDPYLVLGLIRQESCFNHSARSFAGAKGYMQVIPKWHREKVKGRSLYNPLVAIEVGTKVMSEYIGRFGEAKGLAYYSGGARSYYTKVNNHKRELIASINNPSRYNVTVVKYSKNKKDPIAILIKNSNKVKSKSVFNNAPRFI